MAKSLSPARVREFNELLAFLDFYFTKVKGKDVSRPLQDFVNDIAAKHGKSEALEGLRQAANDTLEDLADKSAEYVATLDEALKVANIVTIAELRQRYSTAYRRILKRGYLRNETEYYLIQELVVAQQSAITETERAALQQMLDLFENRVLVHSTKASIKG